MKKRIVVYIGNHGSIDTLAVLAHECISVLRKMGYKVFVVYLNASPQDIQSQANLAFATKPYFVLTFGYTYWYDLKLSGGRGICETLNIPLVVYATDHPLLCQELSGQQLPLQPATSQNTKTLFIVSADARWVDFLKQYASMESSLSKSVFLPLPAFSSRDYPNLKPLLKRNKEILFVGSIIPPDAWRQIWHQKLPNSVSKFIDDIVEYQISAKSDCDQLDNLIQQNLLANMPDLDFQLFTTIFSYAYSYVRFYRRYSLLLMLAKSGLPVRAHLNQPITVNLPSSKEFKIYPATQFQEFVDRIANSQIVLTECSNFCYGGSERLFSTLFNASVAVCNENEWLTKEFNSEQEVVYYSLDRLDTLRDKLDNLLVNPQKMIEISTLGQARAMQTNTVEQFVHNLLKNIELFHNMVVPSK